MARNKLHWWRQVWLYLIAAAGAVTVLVRILDPFKQLLAPAVQFWLPIAFLFAALLAVNSWAVAKAIYRFLLRFSPIGVLLTLAMIILLLYQIRPHGIFPVMIKFDPTRGALYNSWNSRPDSLPVASRRIRVYGSNAPGDELMWALEADSARFSYRVDRAVAQDDRHASSGGYLTFYDTPCRRTEYTSLVFECRITDTPEGCVPDVGVRLAVDGQGRELATYEIESLVAYFRGKDIPDPNWRRFRVYVPDLKQVWVSAEPTNGIDQNTINKIVFFVNEGTVRSCSAGTIWVKDLEMQP